MSLPSLRTARLLLRGFTRADAARVQELAGSRGVASTTLNIPHPYEDGLAERWIDGHLGAWESGERLTLAVTTRGDGLVGSVAMHLIPQHRRGEIGYWIGVDYWNRGFATEAAEALVQYGFEHLHLHRIMGRHLSRNRASGRVLRKLGMVYEGTQREHVIRWGQVEDLECYAVLEQEWRNPSP
jgi:[ribosomal protein S5]-alanine N-acetyltransferase